MTGLPTVTDGDTLVIRDIKVRLFGVDAPESSQTCARAGKTYGCGREAAFSLADLVQGKTVSCFRHDPDRYGRMVAVCTVGGIEINRWLVEQGHALPYLAYGGRSYQDAERQAQVAPEGLHADVFQAPWDYRKNPASPPQRTHPDRLRQAGRPT